MESAVWSLAMIGANLGPRLIAMGSGPMSPAQREFVAHPLFQRAVMWCVFYATTRRPLLAVLLAAMASVVTEGLLDEDSRLCVLPECVRKRMKGNLADEKQRDDAPAAMLAPIFSASSFSGGVPFS